MTTARETDERRYADLKRQIADLSPIRRGSVVRRYMPCGRSGCRCQARPPRLHGPYYQWTRKVRGKTETTRIDKQQAKLLSQWIDNGRKLDRLVAQMETVCLRITQRRLPEARAP